MWPTEGVTEEGLSLRPAPSNQVTELLLEWSNGNSAAREALIPLVYEELRRVAKQCLASQAPHHTLQSTALVHEAYLRLVHQSSVCWENRVHFFSVAALLMRRILVDHARKRRAAKRGGGHITLTLDDALGRERELDLVALDDALKALAELDERQSHIVELRFFGGLSIEDTSHVLDLSPATVKREWATARAWLHREIERGASP